MSDPRGDTAGPGKQLPGDRSTSYLANELLVLESAFRHGLSDHDITHAVTHHIGTFDVGDGMTMVIGPDRAGRLLEVGVVEWHTELAAVHAMPPDPNSCEVTPDAPVP